MDAHLQPIGFMSSLYNNHQTEKERKILEKLKN